MKHIIVLLDVDDMLINFNKSKSFACWNGGSAFIWEEYITVLKKAATEKEMEFHFGIATFKARHDNLSGAVTEHKEFKDPKRGLKTILDEGLEFFTDKKSKVEHAIKPAKARIEGACNTTIDPRDIWLMDDEYAVYLDVSPNYNALYAGDISRLSEIEQLIRIHELFKPIFEKYNLTHLLPKKPAEKTISQQGRFFKPEELDLTGIPRLDEEEKPVATATPAT